jgi:hypothetical protein
MAEQQSQEQKATASEVFGMWKEGNSPTPNNPANFSEAECDQNQLDSPFFLRIWFSPPKRQETTQGSLKSTRKTIQTHTHAFSTQQTRLKPLSR